MRHIEKYTDFLKKLSKRKALFDIDNLKIPVRLNNFNSNLVKLKFINFDQLL